MNILTNELVGGNGQQTLQLIIGNHVVRMTQNCSRVVPYTHSNLLLPFAWVIEGMTTVTSKDRVEEEGAT